MQDWRQFDEPRDWSKATPAERIEHARKLTVQAFEKAGLYPGDRMDKTIVRRLTLEQMRQEDEELDRLLSQRLMK